MPLLPALFRSLNSAFHSLASALRVPRSAFLIFLLALILRLAPGPRTIDDAFITFRYARNLLAGQGLVYNPGEAVLGTTTPLYAALMAGLGALTGGVDAPFPTLALAVNALADAITCLLLVRLAGGVAGAPAAPPPPRAGTQAGPYASPEGSVGTAAAPLPPRAGTQAGPYASLDGEYTRPGDALPDSAIRVPYFAFLPALAWAVAPFSVSFAIGGLETSVYVLLLTWLAVAAFEQRRVLAALLAALALLTRPDALILIGPVFLERLLSGLLGAGGRRRGPRFAAWLALERDEGSWWKELLAFLGPVLAWGIFASLAYGSPLPHSITAKAAAYLLQPGDALIRLLQHYATPFLEQNWLVSILAVGIGLLVYPILVLLGMRQAWRLLNRNAERGTRNAEDGGWKAEGGTGNAESGGGKAESEEGKAGGGRAAFLRLLPWALYPWLYLVTFSLPNPLIFRWYLTPPLPAWFFFIFLGLWRIINNINHRVTEGTEKTKKTEKNFFIKLCVLCASVVPFALALSPLVTDWTLRPDHGPQQPAPQMAFIKLELLYRQAAELLAPRLTPTSVLAAGDVGVLGFYTPARILDTVGLNSPISTSYYPLPPADYVINYAIPARLVLNQRPDWLVILEVYGRRTLLQDAEFLQAYRLVQKIPTDMYGSDGMLIFQRVK